jgi:hypothetical protein
MSGVTKVDYTSRLLRAVFVEGISKSYARFTNPDGTEVTPEMQTKRRAEDFTARLQWLAAALEPVLVQIAKAQGGVPLTTADPRFPDHQQTVDLAPAVGLSAAVYQLSVVRIASGCTRSRARCGSGRRATVQVERSFRSHSTIFSVASDGCCGRYIKRIVRDTFKSRI